MSSQWEAIEGEIKRNLWRNVERAGAAAFRDLVEHAGAVLQSFSSGNEVIDHLRAQPRTDGEQDAIIASLVSGSRQPGSGGALARDLLWLTMWPGLGGVWHRSDVGAWEDAREAISVLMEQFAIVTNRLDLGRVNKVAATIVMNTQRRFWEEMGRRREVRDRELPWDELARKEGKDDPGFALVDALADIETTAGPDAALVISCVAGGVTTREAAASCGCRREAAKKRLLRALERLRADDPCRASRRHVPKSGSLPPLIYWGAMEEEEDGEAGDEPDGDAAVGAATEAGAAGPGAGTVRTHGGRGGGGAWGGVLLRGCGLRCEGTSADPDLQAAEHASGGVNVTENEKARKTS
jgi:hypothetical protein